MLKRLKVKMRRIVHKMSDWIADPPLDVLGAMVIGTSAGRTLLYGAFGLTFAAVGMYTYSAIFFSIVAIDLFIQIEVLAALRRLMRFEVEREIAQHYLGTSLQPG